MKKLIEEFKRNWAIADKEIKGNSTNSGVSKNVIKQFFKHYKNNSDVFETLKNQFDDKRTLYEKRRNATEIPLPQMQIFEINKKYIKKLLEKKISEPEMNERELKIFETLKAFGNKHLENVKTHFSDDKNSYCPFCIQPVDEEHKKNLLDSIDSIFGLDDSKNHKNELRNIKIPKMDIDYSRYQDFDKSLVEQIEEVKEKHNEKVKEIEIKIDKKIDNIFTPVEVDKNFLLPCHRAYYNLIDQLIERVREHNMEIKKIANLKDELITLNKIIAVKENIQVYNDYIKQIESERSSNADFNVLKNELKSLEKELHELKQQKSNVNIAKGLINKFLKYIFFSENRLSIVPSSNENEYAVMCKGKSIDLRSLSVFVKVVVAFFLIVFLSPQSIRIYSTVRLTTSLL
jgi:hypothetical protein